MSGSAAAAIDELKPRSVPVLDAQAAGLKAERLWGMADAQKPASMASGENTMREVSLVARLPVQQQLTSVSASEHHSVLFAGTMTRGGESAEDKRLNCYWSFGRGCRCRPLTIVVYI